MVDSALLLWLSLGKGPNAEEATAIGRKDLTLHGLQPGIDGSTASIATGGGGDLSQFAIK